MANRLTPTPREIHIPKRLIIDETEILSSLGRYIDVARGGERSRGYEEHLLLEDPVVDVLGDGFVEVTHLGGFVCVEQK